MIGQCQKCGNHNWDKEIKDGKVYCPKCGHSWEFISLPLLILTGCSGVGKTTTAMEILQRKVDFVVLDADVFYGYMSLNTDEEYQKQVEAVEQFARNIMQSGKPVLWVLTGNLDKLHHAYNRRFFSDVRCLALVCDEDLLRKRMTEGRGITNEEWIESSVDYNEYFRTHEKIGDTAFDTFDISGKDVPEVADYVIEWVRRVGK